jgi:hypothetical protein
VEDRDTHFALPLPSSKPGIVALMRDLADAAETAGTAADLRKQIEKRRVTIDQRGFYRTFAFGLLGVLALALAFLVWLAPRIHQFALGAPVFVVYTVAGLISAVILFGTMRSYGTFKGEKFGTVFEFGGPAAIFCFVLAGGLLFERYGSEPAEFSVSVYVHLKGNKNDLIRKPGELTLFLDEPKVAPVNEGYASPQRIAAKWNGRSVGFSVRIDGYQPVEKDGQIKLTPAESIFIAMETVQGK